MYVRLVICMGIDFIFQPGNSNICINNKTAQFLLLLGEIRSAARKPASKLRMPRHHINLPWIKYIAPVVEYLYYGDSRHTVFYNREGDFISLQISVNGF